MQHRQDEFRAIFVDDGDEGAPVRLRNPEYILSGFMPFVSL
jgi:hypothetical protein